MVFPHFSAGAAQYGTRQCASESRWAGTKAAIIHNGKPESLTHHDPRRVQPGILKPHNFSPNSSHFAPPRINGQPLKDIAVGVGGTARFECIVQAHPQPQVNWTHNGGLLESGSRHCIEYRNGVCRLTLPQAYPGEYGGQAGQPKVHRTKLWALFTWSI